MAPEIAVWSSMKILVTGSAGFLGSELIPLLQQQGMHVIGMDLNHEDRSDTFYQVDLRMLGQLPQISFDICIHLASAVGGFLFNAQETTLVENEVKIFIGVHHLCQTAACQRILFTSSINVFEIDGDCYESSLKTVNLDTPYAKAKASVEQLVEQSFNEFVIIRPTNLFGSNQGRRSHQVGESHVIPDLLYKIQHSTNGVLEVLGSGAQIRNFLHVEDAARGLLYLIKTPARGWFNMRSKLYLSIGELAQQLIALSGQSLQIDFNTEFQKFEPAPLKPFLSNGLEALGWTPHVESLAQGLHLTLDRK